MRVVLYDLTSAPFSQGYAVQSICRQMGAQPVAAGDVFDHELPDGHGMIYIRLRFPGGTIIEGMWEDDGLSVKCRYKRNEGHSWQRRDIEGSLDCGWHDCPLELRLLTLAEFRAGMGLATAV